MKKGFVQSEVLSIILLISIGIIILSSSFLTRNYVETSIISEREYMFENMISKIEDECKRLQPQSQITLEEKETLKTEEVKVSATCEEYKEDSTNGFSFDSFTEVSDGDIENINTGTLNWGDLTFSGINENELDDGSMFSSGTFSITRNDHDIYVIKYKKCFKKGNIEKCKEGERFVSTKI